MNKIRPRKRSKRIWVSELVPQVDHAFEYLELDIKYIYVSGQNRNALLLSVIDVKSRWVLGQMMHWNIKSKDVIELFDQIFQVYPLPKSFYIRNDNGSQFESHSVQKYFENNKIEQQFCKPATPEQNAHIESYHSIIEKVVCQRYEFESLTECQKTMNRFLRFYNYERIHSGIGYISPHHYLRNNDIMMDQYDLDYVLDCSNSESENLVYNVSEY